MAAADDILNLVAAAQIHALFAQVLGGPFVDAIARCSDGGRGRGVVAILLLSLFGTIITTVIVMMDVATIIVIIIMILGSAQALFLGSMFGFFAKQCFAVFLGNLVIVGMDFAEGEEAVTTAAVIDERRLQRRFNPGYLGKVDVALELLMFGGLKVEFFDPVTLDDRDTGFFPVASIDEHTHCHYKFSGRAAS